MANEFTAKTLYTGRKSGIGPSGVQLTTFQADLYHNLQLTAPSTNAAAVYVGMSGSMTWNSADATDGFPIWPGTTIALPLEAPQELYVASPSGNQTIWFIGG